MLEISPKELQTIVIAALFEMTRHSNDYKITMPAAKKLYKWLIKTNWDEPNKPIIVIDEKPF